MDLSIKSRVFRFSYNMFTESNPWNSQWVDLSENLQETIDFPMKYGMFLQIFP